VSGWIGPRFGEHQQAYEQLLADIAEGARLHYDDPGDDPDLALLTGDMLYARGLATLAELGDVEATAELADVISLVAQARAAGEAELARAVWEAGVVVVEWGTNASYVDAKELARRQAPGAAAALLEAARLARGAASPATAPR
jgi:hypothetical protein